jgi:hypothetical protein
MLGSSAAGHEIFQQSRDPENDQDQNQHADEAHAPPHAFYSVHHLGTSREMVSKHQQLVSRNRCRREFVNGAAARTRHDLTVCQTTGVHACSAQQHLALSGQDAL